MYMQISGKRILLVFHENFLDPCAGNKAYCFSIVNALKSLGFSIDLFAPSSHPSKEFKGFDESNKAHGDLIDNVYLQKHTGQRERYNYFPYTWVDDGEVEQFSRIIAQNHYDFIYIHYVNLLDLVKSTQIPKGIKIIHTMHDFDSAQQFYRGNTNIGKNIEEEIKMLDLCDEITCISADEKHFFEKFLPSKKFHWLPHCCEHKNISSNCRDIDCLFIGYDNPYNLEAVLWFLDEVYPFLNEKIHITICGRVTNGIRKKSPHHYRRMQNLNFELIDFAENLDEIYSRTKIAIVPMLRGTGLKVKTVSSMGYGIPAVTTELGVDGFLDKTENGCLVTNDPKIFANHINNLLNDEIFYGETSQKIKNYFDKHFSAEILTQRLEQIFQNKNAKEKAFPIQAVDGTLKTQTQLSFLRKFKQMLSKLKKK